MTHAPPCLVHKVHNPRVNDTEVHHIFPRGLGGPDVPANKVAICGTGHNNVHALLREWEHLGHAPDKTVLATFHPGERKLAERGWTEWQAAKVLAARPGEPPLAEPAPQPAPTTPTP